MPKLPLTNYFLKQPHSTLNVASLGIFLLVAYAAWGLNVVGQMAFPSLNWVPFLVRSALTVILDVLVLVLSVFLLKQNRIPTEALGLPLSKTNLLNLLSGILIATASLAMIQALLYTRAPFHFDRGTLHVTDLSKEAALTSLEIRWKS